MQFHGTRERVGKVRGAVSSGHDPGVCAWRCKLACKRPNYSNVGGREWFCVTVATTTGAFAEPSADAIAATFHYPTAINWRRYRGQFPLPLPPRIRLKRSRCLYPLLLSQTLTFRMDSQRYRRTTNFSNDSKFVRTSWIDKPGEEDFGGESGGRRRWQPAPSLAALFQRSAPLITSRSRV